MSVRIVNMLDLARRQTLRLVGDLSDEQCHEQPMAEMHTPAWTLGHLMLYDGYLADRLTCDDFTLDKRWEAAFGRGSRPGADLEATFSKGELLKEMDRIRSVLISRVGMLEVEDLVKPNPDESARGNLPTLHDALDYALWHESYHGGQLSNWRKAMGLPRVGIAFLD